MISPAQAKGFVENVTRLKLSGEGHGNCVDKVWILHDDDGSTCPFFKSECGEYENVCFVVAEMSIIETTATKFTVGQELEVVEGGWGLHPELVGKHVTVMSVSERGVDHDYYTVKFANGETRSAAEPSFKGLNIESVPALQLPPPQISDKIDGVYTASQTLAINTFQAMYNAAVAHRNGEPSDLNTDHGICDNIPHFAESGGADRREMAEVKENLIRTTPSFSGEYTYPVKGVNGYSPSSSFDIYSDKWAGEYGLNRLNQLGEMITLIKSDKWDDIFTVRQTPAIRNGLRVGDVVTYTTEGKLWVFRDDDGSTNPSFHRIDNPDAYNYLNLSDVVKVDKDQLKERTVSEFITVIAEKIEEKALIEKMIEELQKQLTGINGDVSILDHSLATQHKVKRIN